MEIALNTDPGVGNICDAPALDQAYGDSALEAYQEKKKKRNSKGKEPATPPKKKDGVKKGPESIKKKHAEEKAGRKHLDAMMGITDGDHLDIQRGERIKMGREVYLPEGEVIRPEDHEEAYGDLWTIYQVARETSAFFSKHFDKFRTLDRAFNKQRIQSIEEQYESLRAKGLVGRWDK